MEAQSQGTVPLASVLTFTSAPGASLPRLRPPRGMGARTLVPPAVAHVSNEWLEK